VTDDLDCFVVLVPFQDTIRHETEARLRDIERLGVRVYRSPGCSAIDFARSLMLTDAHEAGFESMLFIDSDMEFDPVDAIYFLRRPEPVVAGLYTQKSWPKEGGGIKLNADLPTDRDRLHCGRWGGDYRVRQAGTGFFRIRRDACDVLIAKLDMPACTAHGGRVYPFFLPMVEQEEDGQWAYRTEDYAFCRRCAWAGIPVILDTRVRLVHIGAYGYSWEHSIQAKPILSPGLTLPLRAVAGGGIA